MSEAKRMVSENRLRVPGERPDRISLMGHDSETEVFFAFPEPAFREWDFDAGERVGEMQKGQSARDFPHDSILILERSFEAMANSATSKFSRQVIIPRSIAKCSIVLFTFLSVVIGNPFSEKPQADDAVVKNEEFDYEYSNNRYMVIPQDYDSLQSENETIVELSSTSIDDSTAEQSRQQHKLPDRPKVMRANRPVRQQQSSWFSLWSSGKREFSLTGLLESMVGAVTGGLSSIVNNVIGTESKGRKTNPSRVSYKGHQLLRINPVTKNHLKDLLELRDSEAEDVRFWTQPIGNRSTDILISPDVIPDVKDFLREKKIDYTVLIPDLQKTIAYQNPKMSKEQRNDLVSNQGHSMTWKRYHRFGEILKYIEYLTFRYPHLVELITIGHSFEGQPLKVVKVSSGPADDLTPKPAIWIDAGMHAREWISTAVATYILSQLVEKNTTYSRLLDTADWMILPVANPDGYEFSHTGDRLWRKTRSNHADNDNEARYTPTSLYYLVSHYTKWLWTRCDGVDPNRNFGYHWGEDKEGGMSGDPCHETYAGPSAFSEPETKAMAEFIMANRENIRLYLTLHSYSQMWLVPWGHTHNRPDDYSDLANVAKKAAKATAKVYGTSYKVGPSADLLYPTTGASDDWAKGVAGIKYSYTLELRDRGTYGFLLPATQIIPTARETWAGIRTMARLVTNAGT